ncbi:acyl transferase/acyl hydrolase/lysophospholipase [Hygrophoropsis aurantiaca]|uniref:Acyl transferase/acyl hydrolase/lysophospholipase n=1 Tax=Hygrophoropsis aurantiaca TaxID=72124 RepID=A0ACB8A8M5_9AGAM|nr:acyl transferase/acyl hydrolase/lysophospholipase [Hygrophoropsis aurantiaca]
MLIARKFVLSIDGAGFRGYACLVTLHYLMKLLPPNVAGGTTRPCQVFDVICGTSTGGLIAVLIGRLGLDCLTAMSVYKDLVAALFAAVDGNGIIGGEGVPPNVFDQKVATIVEKYAGDKSAPMKISKTCPDKVDHNSTDTFVTVVPSTVGTAGAEPYRLRSYATPPGGVDSVIGHNWTICEVIRAVTALPGYIKSVDIGSQSFQDAALSGAANPVFEAISEVELRWGKQFEPSITSLGTGLVSFVSIDSDDELSDRDDEPVYDKLRRAVKSQHSRGMSRSDVFSEQLLRVAQDTELAHREARKQLSKRNLADNYFRFDPTGGLGDIRTSDVTQAAKITALTNTWLRTQEGTNETRRARHVLQTHLAEIRARSSSILPL